MYEALIIFFKIIGLEATTESVFVVFLCIIVCFLAVNMVISNSK